MALQLVRRPATTERDAPSRAPGSGAPDAPAHRVPPDADVRAWPPLVPDPPEPRSAWRPRRSMRVLGCCFILALVISVALEPAPNGPDPAVRWWDDVAALLLLAVYPTAVVGLLRGALWSPKAAVGAGGVILAGTLACPASGHHLIGWWWFT